MPAAMRSACGLMLIAVGVLAIPIPVIRGIPLIVAGAAMLGSAPAGRGCKPEEF